MILALRRGDMTRVPLTVRNLAQSTAGVVPRKDGLAPSRKRVSARSVGSRGRTGQG